MGKYVRILKEKDVGSIGIGAMIVFIAMVLVAGIAASVLIQTSTSLESQALATGQETTAEVSSGLDVVDIYGRHVSSSLNWIVITIRPRAGSADMDLAQTVIEISDSATKNFLTYDDTTYEDSDDIDVMNPIRLGTDALGERGKRAEIVGEEAAWKLRSEIESGAAVDQHMCDNMIPFVALFGGELKSSELTDHSKTNVYVVEKFLGKCLEVDEEKKIIRKISD